MLMVPIFVGFICWLLGIRFKFQDSSFHFSEPKFGITMLNGAKWTDKDRRQLIKGMVVFLVVFEFWMLYNFFTLWS